MGAVPAGSWRWLPVVASGSPEERYWQWWSPVTAFSCVSCLFQAEYRTKRPECNEYDTFYLELGSSSSAGQRGEGGPERRTAGVLYMEYEPAMSERGASSKKKRPGPRSSASRDNGSVDEMASLFFFFFFLGVRRPREGRGPTYRICDGRCSLLHTRNPDRTRTSPL